MSDDDFTAEEITRTIPGLANAIATESATALVFECDADAAAHYRWSMAIARQKGTR